jgi:hypothetical protein
VVESVSVFEFVFEGGGHVRRAKRVMERNVWAESDENSSLAAL